MQNPTLAVAAAAFSSVALSALPANADVQRYQEQYVKFRATVETHFFNDYEVTLNPCNYMFQGKGVCATPGGTQCSQTISGSIDNHVLSFTAEYFDVNSGNPLNYVWKYRSGNNFDITTWMSSGVGSDSSSNPPFTNILRTMTEASQITTSHYRNHGDFVSQQSDKNDAAHSCIGKPIQSQSNAPRLQ